MVDESATAAAWRVLLSEVVFVLAVLAAVMASCFAGYTAARHEWVWMAVATALAVGLWGSVAHIAFLLGVDHAER